MNNDKNINKAMPCPKPDPMPNPIPNPCGMSNMPPYYPPHMIGMHPYGPPPGYPMQPYPMPCNQPVGYPPPMYPPPYMMPPNPNNKVQNIPCTQNIYNEMYYPGFPHPQYMPPVPKINDFHHVPPPGYPYQFGNQNAQIDMHHIQKNNLKEPKINNIVNSRNVNLNPKEVTINRYKSPEKNYRRSPPRRRSRSRDRIQRSTSRSSRRSMSRDSRYRRSPSRNSVRSFYSRPRRSRSRSRSRRASPSRGRGQEETDRRGRNRSPFRRRRRSLDYKEDKSDDRQKLIEKWRMNYCDSQDQMQKRLQEISQMNPDEILEEENKIWIRSAPADRYYERDENDLKKMRATGRLDQLCEKFKFELLERGERVRATQTLPCPQPLKPKQKLCKHISQACSSSDDSDSDESDDSDDVNHMMEELQRKQQHPYRLHPELWFNDPGEMNDGPLCRCSAKARRSGIRHGFYAGEGQNTICDVKSNNAGNLYHYRITISPPTNFLTRTPTIINHDDHEFIFEGFSLISHYPIEKLPTCKVIRFNIEYIILYVEEKLPENFSIQELDLFYNYLFKEILELVDFDLSNPNFPDGCPQFHFMPRFVRELPDNGRELLPMCEVLKYLLNSNKLLIDDETLKNVHDMSKTEWQNFADFVKGMVVTNPGMKPCSLRVDQLDRETDPEPKTGSASPCSSGSSSRLRNDDPDDQKSKNTRSDQNPPNDDETNQPEVQEIEEIETVKESSPFFPAAQNKPKKNSLYPEIVHFGIRPPQLSYAGNPEYQKAWREYVKFRHLLANMPKPTFEDKQKLAGKENRLQTMRTHSKMKRDVTVTVSSENFYLTGLMCDVVQHAMLIPVLVCHLRFHRSLHVLEEKIKYKFQNRFLLQLALTHPSYRENFGTNPDHARNSLTNCGIRQPEYGDRRIHYMNTRKRGINTLISIMSRFGKKNETQSNIYHNERLEFLGDAVVEFITSIHLFHMFRDLEEGGLATYRAALVQNQHLAVLAKKLNLDEFMLYAHGSDLCHDLELKHAMANCFEALMGALFLDGDIKSADNVFGDTLYGDDDECLDVWFNYPPHPLQEQEPLGDRKWISQFPLLQKLKEFEDATGIEFKHIRLLARAFTDRSVGYTNLTLGSNQRLEFLGDSVLQLIASEYLYKYFPEHHEGHLSLLRSSLVNNKTQSVVCDDLGMTKFAVYANPKVELKIKDRADLLEAFLGALYVDNQNLDICKVFCDICFFPRLQDFIMNQDWNDPKSKLQQCCLTLRTMDGGEPDIPIYKVVECKGPTNTRVYTVAVYFRNKRLAQATGHSIQQAEMNAAQKAMEVSGPLFPQLDHQKRVIAKSLKTQKWPNRSAWYNDDREEDCRSRSRDDDNFRSRSRDGDSVKSRSRDDDNFRSRIRDDFKPRNREKRSSSK